MISISRLKIINFNGGYTMKKTFKTILVIVLCISFSYTVFANSMSDSISRGVVCDKCGGSLYNSNKTMSILINQELIPCGSVYGTPGWGDDFKNTYDVYNTYICSGCGDTIPRNYLSQQIKYYCIEGGRYYNPVTGQKVDLIIENFHNNDKHNHEKYLKKLQEALFVSVEEI